VLIWAENAIDQPTLQALADGVCAPANEIAPIQFSTQPQDNLDQQLQLLAGQNALPTIFGAGNAPWLVREFNDAGLVVNIGDELEALGLIDMVNPAALSAINNLYGGEFIVVPFGGSWDIR